MYFVALQQLFVFYRQFRQMGETDRGGRFRAGPVRGRSRDCQTRRTRGWFLYYHRGQDKVIPNSLCLYRLHAGLGTRKPFKSCLKQLHLDIQVSHLYDQSLVFFRFGKAVESIHVASIYRTVCFWFSLNKLYCSGYKLYKRHQALHCL